MAKKSTFTEEQILAVVRQRKITRKAALKFLNREHVGKTAAPAPAAATKAERNFNPETKSYETVQAHAPVADAPKAKKVAAPKAAKPAPAGVSADGLARRVSGTNRYNVAGRPTREQIELVYGPKSFAMTWPQREALGVTAEQFQDALKAKQTGAAATN